jgi:hypothetical protein
VHGIIENDEAAIACADEILLNNFAGVLLENKGVMFKAKLNGGVQHFLKKERNKRLLKLTVRTVLVNINAQHRFVGYFPYLNILFQMLVKLAFLRYDIGFFKYNPLVILMKNAPYFFVIQNFNGLGHGSDLKLFVTAKLELHLDL